MSSLNASNQISTYGVPRSCEHEWVSRYFDSVNEDTSIEEMVDFLVSFKLALQAKGYDLPALSDLCLELRDALIHQGIDIGDEEVERIYEEISKREITYVQPSSYLTIINDELNGKIIEIKKKEKKHKDVKVSGKVAVGFIKFLAGALCCIVPIPAVQVVGATLAGAGLVDMVDGAKEDADKRENQDPMDLERRLPKPEAVK